MYFIGAFSAAGQVQLSSIVFEKRQKSLQPESHKQSGWISRAKGKRENRLEDGQLHGFYHPCVQTSVR